MNLAVLRRSRPKLQPGDIFAMLPPVGGYLYGRVMSTQVPMAGGDFILIYVYKDRSAAKLPVPRLKPANLLIRPSVTNRLPWTTGYFENLAHQELGEEDRFVGHCFKTFTGDYLDEMGNAMAGPTASVSVWALDSYRTIDASISRALGIPLSQDGGAAKPRKRTKRAT